MKKIIIILMLIALILLIGCTGNHLESFNEEIDLLNKRILELEEEITKKDEQVEELENLVSAITDERDKLNKSIDMIRFSAYARLDDYNNSFYNLEKIYDIKSKYVIEDDWYVIGEDYFEIELLGYEDAKKVDFYVLRQESDVDERMIFSDTNFGDRWKYISNDISQIIEKHKKSKSGGFLYEPYFVIYTKVTLHDGSIITTPRLPIYYR